MTLIIGRVNAGKTYIIGDTALTLHNQAKSNAFVDGCLKQYIVNETLAIAFAGSQPHFESVCPQLLASVDTAEAVQVALTAQRGGLEFDLLVGETGSQSISVVRDGVVSETVAGYIGDAFAFARFQQYYHDDKTTLVAEWDVGRASIQFLRLPEPVGEDEIYERLFNALKRVIWDSQVHSVGGVIVPLCMDQGRFRYLNYADVTSDPLNIDDVSEEPKAIQFGTAAAGGYSIELNDDVAYGGDGRNIGFYFLQGGFGIVFPPNAQGLRAARVVKANNPAYWVLETKNLLGYGIASAYMTADHCGLAGEELLRSARYDHALFCYELRKDWKPLSPTSSVYDRYFAGYAIAMFNSGRRVDAVSLVTEILTKGTGGHRCRMALRDMEDATGRS